MNAQDTPDARLTHEDMQEFFNLTLEMLCVAGFDGYFKRLNPVWTRVLGYTLDELLAEPFLTFVHPGDRDRTAAAVKDAQGGAEFVSFKNRYRAKDGSYRVLEWTCSPSPQRHILCAVARDVTTREREQERLARLIKASRVVLYSLTLGPQGITGASFMSDNVLDEFGMSASEFLADGNAWVARVHPEDRPIIFQSQDGLLATGSQELRYRFLHKDGTYRYVQDERKLVRDADGRPVEVIGSQRDITESVRAEELIRTQAAALTELSTPLIPISDRVVVMPLIGTMDSQRAKQILDTLLHGVSQSRASVAILDITGVTVVDSQVANALLMAAKAVRLLGAEVVLTGIRPEVARTLVGLGVELTDIVTRGTLQAGIAYAMDGGLDGALDGELGGELTSASTSAATYPRGARSR